MSDYRFQTDVLRGQMARELGSDEEHFVFVISDALVGIDIDHAIELGELGDEAENNPCEVVNRLRKLACAIEDGEIT